MVVPIAIVDDGSWEPLGRLLIVTLPSNAYLARSEPKGWLYSNRRAPAQSNQNINLQAVQIDLIRSILQVIISFICFLELAGVAIGLQIE